MKGLYDLKLGEELEYEGNYFLRVPGGWVHYLRYGNAAASCFIPYDDEFRTKGAK